MDTSSIEPNVIMLPNEKININEYLINDEFEFSVNNINDALRNNKLIFDELHLINLQK